MWRKATGGRTPVAPLIFKKYSRGGYSDASELLLGYFWFSYCNVESVNKTFYNTFSLHTSEKRDIFICLPFGNYRINLGNCRWRSDRAHIVKNIRRFLFFRTNSSSFEVFQNMCDVIDGRPQQLIKRIEAVFTSHGGTIVRRK